MSGTLSQLGVHFLWKGRTETIIQKQSNGEHITDKLVLNLSRQITVFVEIVY